MSVTVLLAEKTSSAKKPPICRSIVTVFVTSAHHVYIGINLTNCSGDIGGYYSSCHTIEARTTSQ